MQLSNIFTMLNDDLTQEQKAKLRRIVDDYIFTLKKEMIVQNPILTRNQLLSELNFRERGDLKSCRYFDITVREGDIVYVDYGKAYNLEMGYQHFGVVMRIYDAKAFVVPMTSNMETYHTAYDEIYNPEGLKHLMRIGKQQGCYKYSVLYLNDAKFINTARIINIKGHISTNSKLYKKIMERLVEIIQMGQ